jgi:translocation and assembly module TamB
VEPFVMRGPNTELSGAGSFGDEVSMNVNGSLDMRLLESFVPSLERTGGRVDLTANVSGPVSHPIIGGNAVLKDLKVSVRDQPLSVRSLSGEVEFSESRVLIKEVYGILNEGQLSARGDLRLSKFEVKSIDVDLNLREASFRPLEYLPITATGELTLSGKPDALLLAGDVELVKLRYEQPLDLESLLKDVKKARYGTGAEKPKEWLTFNVGLSASGDVRVDNNLARAALGGKVTLVGTNVRPGLRGEIRTKEGSQALLRTTQLRIDKGQLEFNDPKAIDPVIELEAVTKVREYTVRLQVFGRLSDYKVRYVSEPPLAEPDIISLLALGVTSRDRGGEAGADLGAAAEALLSVTGLDRHIQQFLPKNRLLKDLSIHIESLYNPASGLVEPTGILESKFLVDDLKLRMMQPVYGRGTRAQAEWRFNDRISGSAQWDNENQDYSFGNPGLDLKFKWESK